MADFSLEEIIIVYFQIGFNTPQLAAPIWKLEIAGREAKKFAKIPPQLAVGIANF